MKNLKKMYLPIFLIFAIFSCSSDKITELDSENNDDEVVIEIDDTDFEPTDWTTETHSNDADPNFDEVFADNEVKRLDFVISEDNWQAMLDDMTSLYGTFGTGRGTFSDDDDDPIFVPGEVFYEGKEWYKVGLRFKGNSSLATAWSDGHFKIIV